VTTIGYLGPRKSHELFVAAASLVARRRPKTSFLVLGEGPARESLQAQIDAAGLNGRILLTGVRRDLDRILPATDICVKPGVLEGFIGITVLEAQSFRVPVVAFDTVDVRMAIEDGKTGMIVERGSVPGLARALEGLLDHPAKAEQLARAGRELVVERFAIERVASGLVEAYRDQLRR
jgi:glycosyltransferase involved in cell wall biosynthesis